MRGFLLAPLLMLTACATTASPPLELAGTSWQLASADGGKLAKSEARIVTAAFTADRISGNGGCNRYDGSYTLAGSTLTVGPVAATKRACMGDEGDIESEWFAALGKPLQATRVDGQLQLRTADGATLKFAPAAKP